MLVVLADAVESTWNSRGRPLPKMFFLTIVGREGRTLMLTLPLLSVEDESSSKGVVVFSILVLITSPQPLAIESVSQCMSTSSSSTTTNPSTPGLCAATLSTLELEASTHCCTLVLWFDDGGERRWITLVGVSISSSSSSSDPSRMAIEICRDLFESGSETPRGPNMGLGSGKTESAGEIETGRFRLGAGHVSLT